MRFETAVLEMQGPWWRSAAALLLLFFAARGAGCWLLPRFHDEYMRFSLGTAVLAWFYPWYWRGVPWWLTTVVLLIPAARGVWDLPWWEIKSRRRLAVVLGVAGLFTVASAFLPPYTWDEQVYQTVLYKRFSETAWCIDNPYAAYPLLPQLLFQWVGAWGTLALPRLFVWLLSLILAGKMYLEAVRRSRNAAFGLVSTLCVMLSPLALTLSQSFYAESFIALFALAGFLALESDGDAAVETERRNSILAGIFAGACVAVKLTGVGAALMLAVFALKRRRIRWFIPAAAVAALPFYLRPWLVFGNPFYPFGAAWWGRAVSVPVEQFFRALGDFGIGRIWGVFFGWFFVCVDGEFFDGVVCGFGVLMLTVLTAVSLVWRRRGDKSARFAFAALAAGYIFWALTSQQTRFLYPLIFPAALLLADGFPGARTRRMQIVVTVVLALGTLLSWWSYPRLRHYWTAWRMLPLARTEPVRFLTLATNDSGYFNTLKLLDAVASEKARVMLLLERRSLYVPRRFEHGTPLFQETRLTPPPRTPEELWTGIRDFDYILFGSMLEHIDRRKSYEAVEAQVGQLVLELVRRGRLRPVALPRGVAAQPLLEVVHER
jgi:hypothetical protein